MAGECVGVAEAACLSLNAWARVFGDGRDVVRAAQQADARFLKARNAASQRLVANGGLRDWAKGMLDARAAAQTLPERVLWEALALLDLSGAVVDATFDAGGTHLPGPLVARDARFAREVWLNHAAFDEGAEFAGAVFEQDASFEGAVFGAAARFERAVFERDAQFRGARFLADANFQELQVKGDWWMRSGTQFAGGADFSWSTFAREAGFGETRFGGRTDFSACSFGGGASFDACAFGGEAKFSRAVFGGNLWMDGARFDGPARFDLVRLRGKVSVEDVAFANADDAAIAATALRGSG